MEEGALEVVELEGVDAPPDGEVASDVELPVPPVAVLPATVAPAALLAAGVLEPGAF